MIKWIVPLLVAVTAYWYLTRSEAPPQMEEKVVAEVKRERTEEASHEERFTVLPLPRSASKLLTAHDAEARDEQWADKTERKFTADFNALHDGLSQARKELWGASLKSIDCRNKTCVAEIATKGFAQWLGYLEQAILDQGDFEPTKLPFSMKCMPSAVYREVEGDVPEEMPGYTASLVFDCSRPALGPMKPAPNPEHDRFLNPELYAKLPPELQTEENVKRAEEVYEREKREWIAEMAKRTDPNLVRLEP